MNASGSPEAHRVREEYVVERELPGGSWVVESIHPADTAEQAEVDAAWVTDRRPAERFRTVCRTIVSTVAAIKEPRK